MEDYVKNYLLTSEDEDGKEYKQAVSFHSKEDIDIDFENFSLEGTSIKQIEEIYSVNTYHVIKKNLPVEKKKNWFQKLFKG